MPAPPPPRRPCWLVRAKESAMDAEVAAGRTLPTWMEGPLRAKTIRAID